MPLEIGVVKNLILGHLSPNNVVYPIFIFILFYLLTIINGMV
jgi:hypothetical protein